MINLKNKMAQITEQQVEEQFNNIHTISQALQFVNWIEKNSMNMDADLYDVAIKSGNQYYKELKENRINELLGNTTNK